MKKQSCERTWNPHSGLTRQPGLGLWWSWWSVIHWPDQQSNSLWSHRFSSLHCVSLTSIECELTDSWFSLTSHTVTVSLKDPLRSTVKQSEQSNPFECLCYWPDPVLLWAEHKHGRGGRRAATVWLSESESLRQERPAVHRHVGPDIIDGSKFNKSCTEQHLHPQINLVSKHCVSDHMWSAIKQDPKLTFIVFY